MTANSSLSGPRRPGTFVEQNAVMASSGPGVSAPGANAPWVDAPPRALSYGHRSLHRPTHVPFSPIRSRIVPSPPTPSPSVCNQGLSAHRGRSGGPSVCKTGLPAHGDGRKTPSVCNRGLSAHRGRSGGPSVCKTGLPAHDGGRKTPLVCNQRLSAHRG